MIPNKADAAFPDQAEWDSVDVEILLAGALMTGVAEGLDVSHVSGLTFEVAPGTPSFAGVQTFSLVSPASVTLNPADATHPRFDLIVINNSASVGKATGTPAAAPFFPPIPADSVVLRAVRVPAGETTSAESRSTDKRVMVSAATGTGGAVVLATSPTLETPTIASFASAQHGHATAAGGGTLDAAALASGTLPAARGGTGQSSYTVGDLLYASGTTALSKRAAVAIKQALISQGVGTAPIWSASVALAAVSAASFILDPTNADLYLSGVKFQVHTNGDDYLALVNGNVNTTDKGFLVDGHRGALGSASVVASPDILCNFYVRGYDGSSYTIGAYWQVFVDAAVGAGDVRAAHIFGTRGADGLLERLRIASNGSVTIQKGLNVVGSAFATGMGVGTTAPNRLASLNAAATPYMGFEIAGTEKWVVGAEATRFIMYDTAGALYRLVVNNNGGVDVVLGGLTVGNPTGGNKGAGTVNAAGAYYANGTIGATLSQAFLQSVGVSKTMNFTNGLLISIT